jgi:hypothetical protein
MADWTLIKEFKKTDWAATAIYNFERAFAAGLVWIPLTLIVNKETTASFLLFPLVYFVYLVPLRLVTYFVCNLNIPLVCPILGFLAMFGSIAVVVGDPVVYLLYRVLPAGIIPVLKPKFFHFDVIVFVTKTKIPEDFHADEGVTYAPDPPGGHLQEDFANLSSPVSTARTTSAANEIGSDYAQSVMTEGLIKQAVLLELENSEESREKAHFLWEQALKIGNLSKHDNLLCHYYLGAYHQGKENLVEAIRHREAVVVADPELTSLVEEDPGLRAAQRNDLYKSLSAAYQFYARTTVKEAQGVEGAIRYMEEKLGIIGRMAAPSLLVELASYYGLTGRHGKAREIFREAAHAPTYGSEFQEKAKASAVEFLSEDVPAEASEKSEEIVKQGPAPVFGELETKRRSPAIKWALIGLVGIGAIAGSVLVLMPSQYKEYFKKAQEAYRSGNYAEALTLANLAKEKKTTTELTNFETKVHYQIKQIEARQAAERLQREYDELYQKARAAFGRRDFAGALDYARLAMGIKRTAEIGTLVRQIRSARSQQQEKESQKTLISSDDAAYQLAVQLNTERSYSEYIQAYPKGKNTLAAEIQLATLQGRRERAQLAAQSNSVPMPQSSGVTGTAEANKQEGTGSKSEPSSLAKFVGNWEFKWENGGPPLPLSISQHGGLLSVQLSRLSGNGAVANRGAGIIWTLNDQWPGAQSKNDFTCQMDGDRISGHSTQVISYSDGRTQVVERKWHAYRVK